MLRRSTREQVPTAASIGQGASARKRVMRSSSPAVTSSSVSSAVMSTLQCDASNMHVNELPFETCKASDDITRNAAQPLNKK